MSAAGGTVCSQQDLFPLPGMSIALPKHPAAVPALDGVCQHSAGGSKELPACLEASEQRVGLGWARRAALGKGLSPSLNAQASLRPFLSLFHLSWVQECHKGPAQWPKAGGAVSCDNQPGQQDRTHAAVSPCCTSALALRGMSWRELCLFPQIHIPQAGLAAPMSLGTLLGLWLTKKLLMELFSLELKLITYFSWFPLGSAVGSFARVLQGTGMACTGAWNHSRVGMHCPEPASF